MCRTALPLLSVLSLLLLGACQSGEPDTTGQQSDGFPAPSKDIVWESAVRAVKRQGFVVDTVNSSAAAGIVTTTWNTQLAPFSGQGRRDKATVRVHDVPGRSGFYRVETNVQHQRNVNIASPGDPLRAEWTDPERLSMMENMITRTIEMEFVSGDVTDRFRERYDLPASENPRIRTPPPVVEEPPTDPILGLPLGR